MRKNLLAAVLALLLAFGLVACEAADDPVDVDPADPAEEMDDMEDPMEDMDDMEEDEDA